jgi:colanic acid biosynthesis glycosyl transferase WcaI
LDPASLPKVTVVHNWAPLGELPARTKENAWSMEHGLASTFNFIYTGTLGMKHDPELLVQLAQAIRDRPGVRVIVVSEGPGADYVKRRAAEFDLGNLIVLPFQPYDRLPEVMGAADVLLALLEEDAGVFSVPSKILTYHCAARPILASMPLDNLAAQTVVSAGSGTVTPARDPDAFVRAALELLNTDPSERARVGMAARRYAEETFDLDRIADRFSGLMGVEGSGDSADVVRR